MQLTLEITNEGLAVFQWGAVLGASLVAAISDLRTGRIPNVLTGPLFVAGLIYATWLGGLAGMADAIGACILLALPYVLMFLFAHGGAGDAKLMGAIGAWLGLTQGVVVLTCVLICGMVLAVTKAMAKRSLIPVLSGVLASVYVFMVSLATRFRTRQSGACQVAAGSPEGLSIPYGVAIFAGVCAGGGILWLS